MTTERGTGATPSACGQDVPDALVEKAAQALRDGFLWPPGIRHKELARAVLAAVWDQFARDVLSAVDAEVRARLQAADDRLAEVRREVAGRPCGCHWCCQATSPELRGTSHRNCQREART